MMPHRNQKRRRARLLQLRRQPRQLLCLLCRSQRKVRPTVPPPVCRRHIAVQRNHRHQRLLCWKLKPIPQRRHRPPRPRSLRILQLRRHLTLRHPLVVVISSDRIRRAIEHALRIHLFELCLPTLVLHSTRQWPIPVIAEHQQCFGRKILCLDIILHRLCHTRLRLEVFVTPIAHHQQTRTATRRVLML